MRRGAKRRFAQATALSCFGEETPQFAAADPLERPRRPEKRGAEQECPEQKMMIAPPMAQVVHTTFAEALLVPPSLSASSREPSANVASTATVMAVPNAMAKVAATPAQNSPWVTAKTSTRMAPVQGLMPTDNTTAITFRHENGPASSRASTM